MKIEGPFGAKALRILRQIPGLTVTVAPRMAVSGRPDRQVDAVLRLAGTRTPIAVEFKRRANAAAARQVVQYASTNPGLPFLLIADETTAEARQILEDHGVAVVDGLGNAHVELPGLLVHLEGRRQDGAGTTPAPRLIGKAGVVAQALLLQPDRPWHVQDLANDAEVSPSLAHRVLTRLEEEAIVVAEGRGPKRVRRVVDSAALLDLWAEEQTEQPTRTHAYLLAPTPQKLVRELGANLGQAGIDYALTGAAGASQVAPFVTAIPVAEVWVAATAAPEELYDGARADPVADGQNVVFLQGKDDTPLAFREQAKGLWLANRFRLYADLRRNPRRGREQAEHLRREVIGF